MPSPATPTLVCKQCGFGNEPERVYCHNCGAKLDRSLLPPEATKREDPVVVQGRLKKMTNPKRGEGLRNFKNLAICVATAAVLAAVLLIFLPPLNAPELSKEELFSAPTISDDMENLTQFNAPRSLRYTGKQVNAFLGYSIKGKEESLFGVVPAKFERAYVQFGEGTCRIYMQQSIGFLSIYANGLYSVQIINGKLVSKNLGGGLGRLSFPAPLSDAVDKALFPRLWKATERDQKLLAQMRSIAFHKDMVEIISKPAGTP